MADLKTVDVPEQVTREVKRLHFQLVEHSKTFEASRQAFGEYLRGTMKILNVPVDGSWDLNDEATQFKERSNANVGV